ncbi:MAG TPA: phosphotransferase [Rhizomicrobium sp.]|nr:phosphotransferase [Rhizomicrobium sp.]
MSDRHEAMTAFLHDAGWGDGEAHALPGDASTRRYFRVSSKGRHAMLMDQPQHVETPPAPPEASPEERQRLGYNAVARLAGADCGRFVAVSDFLRRRGLSAPQIYAADCDAGFVLMEDFGDRLYADILASGGNEYELYSAAVEALAALHAHSPPAQISPRVSLYSYDETAMLAETGLLTEWYLPLVLGRKATAEETAEHRALWQKLLSETSEAAPTFVHRDYHAQNLLWLPDRSGIARVGMIDFQDAVAGSKAYDLASLLEDARRDVSTELAESMIAHYISAVRKQGMPVDEAQFRRAFATIAAQRNAKIAGIFARLQVRDRKPRYLGYLPRVWGYLRHDLEHPSLAALKNWYERILPPDAREGRIEGVAA